MAQVTFVNSEDLERGCPIQAARFWPLEWGFSFAPRRTYGVSSHFTAHRNVSPVTVSRHPRTVSSTHALGPQAIPERRYTSLHHLQLLPPPTAFDETWRGANVRASSRRSTSEIRLLRLRLCRHARARPPAGERTRTRHFGHSDQSSQTVGRTATNQAGRRH